MHHITVYVKTTETCQLNCKHCFTNGINGRKIYFNPDKTVSWIKKLKTAYKDNPIHFEFHGGEPFLAPIKDLRKVVAETKNLWNDCSYGITSNLVLNLDKEKVDFIQEDLKGIIGTSWDKSIRFTNTKQYDLWESNVKYLKSLNCYVTVFVSVTKELCNSDPEHIIKYFNSLGIDSVDFERLTNHGNAKLHPDIFPSNKEQDEWFLKLYNSSTKKLWKDSFLDSIVKTRVNGSQTATFCRDCEQKLFTINADGTISGCPNAAPEEVYGHIDDEIWDLIWNPKRQRLICEEAARDPRCYSCEVFDLCGSGCHQLEWDETHCPSPKSLFKLLKETPIAKLKGGYYAATE